LQGFSSKEISKFEILDMVYAMRSCKNINEDNAEEWLQSDVCELGLQHMTDTDIVSVVATQKGEEEAGEDESEEE
jgi:hypothetical protein